MLLTGAEVLTVVELVIVLVQVRVVNVEDVEALVVDEVLVVDTEVEVLAVNEEAWVVDE